MTDLLDLDGEVLHDYWSAALDWVGAAAATRRAPGCSTSARAPAPARSGWPSASPGPRSSRWTSSQARSRGCADKAAGRGLAGRVRALEADLDAGWPDLGPLDLTWASMSLHHLADPGRVLGDALAATRPAA